MGEECDHDWIPYRMSGFETPEIAGVNSHLKVTEVKCIKCDETKEID